jgi:hypothetical protein
VEMNHPSVEKAEQPHQGDTAREQASALGAAWSLVCSAWPAAWSRGGRRPRTRDAAYRWGSATPRRAGVRAFQGGSPARPG